MEVRRLLASLRPSDWEQEEVELIPVVAGALDKITVNQATARRVFKTTIAAFDKERLHDALINDHKSNLRLASCLVIYSLTSIYELPNLSVDYVIAFSTANTIAEDDDVSWIHASMSSGKDFNRFLEAILKLRVDHFLTFLLDDEIREVL